MPNGCRLELIGCVAAPRQWGSGAALQANASGGKRIHVWQRLLDGQA